MAEIILFPLDVQISVRLSRGDTIGALNLLDNAMLQPGPADYSDEDFDRAVDLLRPFLVDGMKIG